MILPVSAQIRGNNIVVMVSPDHKDWNYCVGEKAHFEVSVLKSSTLLNNIVVEIIKTSKGKPPIKGAYVLINIRFYSSVQFFIVHNKRFDFLQILEELFVLIKNIFDQSINCFIGIILSD